MSIGEYFQPYSLAWVTGVLLLIVAVILFRTRPRLPQIVAFASIVIGLLVAYFYVRPVPTPLIGEDAAKVQAMIGRGKPVLLEFQSPYCIGCTALKPAVDQAEKQYAGRLSIIRINIQDKVGMDLKPIYHYQYTPTFIFFDEEGHELWREIGTFDAAKLSAEMASRPTSCRPCVTPALHQAQRGASVPLARRQRRSR